MAAADTPQCTALATAAWALAMAAHADALLFTLLAMAAEGRVHSFSPQELGNMAWALATADNSDALLFVALARAVERRLGGFKAQDLANMAWAYTTAG